MMFARALRSIRQAPGSRSWRTGPAAALARSAALLLAGVSCSPSALQGALAASPEPAVQAEHAAAQPAADLPVLPVRSCASLVSLDLRDVGGPGSRVTSAVEGSGTIDGPGVRFCTVEGVLAPEVRFRVRLPVATWTGRYVHMGCGGLCGFASPALAPDQAFQSSLARAGGLVLSSTDMGHAGPGTAWTDDPRKRADFAYRAVHVTRLAAGRLTRAYYGRDPRSAYFIGCSDGGREGLVAAQRHPTDFNGIVVGAPALLFQMQNSLYHGWLARANHDNGRTSGRIVLEPAKAALLHRAVLAACDGLDGVRDGTVADPRACRFDPGVLQCAAGATDTSGCLSAAELATVRAIYDGPRDPASHLPLVVGQPQLGSELNWAGVFVPASPTDRRLFSEFIVDSARNLVFAERPAPTLDQFIFDQGFYAKLWPRHALNDATDPDLSAFRAAGGRLILWHGWADPQISPIGTIAYYEALQRTMGRAAVDSFVRLYLLPGVSHCGGGQGHPDMDLLDPIVHWVEEGQPAQTVISYRTDAGGKVISSRPVYPYPAVARYDGHGYVDSASSFRPGPPLYDGPVPAWAGSSWFSGRPGTR